jgi:hypothetical protein
MVSTIPYWDRPWYGPACQLRAMKPPKSFLGMPRPTCKFSVATGERIKYDPPRKLKY